MTTDKCFSSDLCENQNANIININVLYMKSFKLIILFVAGFCLFSANAFSANKNDNEENVIAQMNYCITSLTNIIHNKSISVLENESDQIVNNLTMEQIVNLYDIKEFRLELIDAMNKFEITEEEKMLMRRISSIRRDNAKWEALSGALSGAMFLTGGSPKQMAVQATYQLLTGAVRGMAEYKQAKGEENIEELRAMWELRKEDLRTITELRKRAFEIEYSLYNKFKLSEKDRLTESTANSLMNYVMEPDAARRIRLLEDNKDTYKKMAPYYYYLGMAYVDVDNYNKAKPNFDTYLNMYKKAPIFRYDEKSGCIALVMLINEKNLSNERKKELINMAMENLPNNSAAILQCALMYIFDMGMVREGFSLLRKGLDAHDATDKAILYMTVARLINMADKYPDLQKELSDEFEKASQVDFESYVTYLINTNANAWKKMSTALTIDDCNKRVWYTLGIKKDFNNKFHIVLPERISYNDGDLSVYMEKYESEKLTIDQMNLNYTNAVPAKKIDKVKCFKAHKNLKYLFVDVIIPNELFAVKHNIDCEKIKNREWPRMSEFAKPSLTDDDIDDIVDFCEKYAPETDGLDLECEKMSGDYVEIDTIPGLFIKFNGDTLPYIPSAFGNGYYIHIVLKNGINLIYKYDDDNHEINPYMYYMGNDNNAVYASWLNGMQNAVANYISSYLYQKCDGKLPNSDDSSDAIKWLKKYASKVGDEAVHFLESNFPILTSIYNWFIED